MPKEVEHALLNGPNKMFFFDKVARDRFDEDVLEVNYRSKFPNVHVTLNKLQKQYEETNRGFFQFDEEYRVCSDGEFRDCVGAMTYKMAFRIPPTGLHGINNPLDSSTDIQTYIDALIVKFKKFCEKDPNTDFIIIFDSPLQEKRDWEKRDAKEEEKFLQLLRALCKLMLDFKFRLKVIVIFNNINKFWDQLINSTSSPKDDGIRSVCTAHKFDSEGHWSQSWPEQNEAQ